MNFSWAVEQTHVRAPFLGPWATFWAFSFSPFLLTEYATLNHARGRHMEPRQTCTIHVFRKMQHAQIAMPSSRCCCSSLNTLPHRLLCTSLPPLSLSLPLPLAPFPCLLIHERQAYRCKFNTDLGQRGEVNVGLPFC